MKQQSLKKRIFIIEDDEFQMDMASLALGNFFAKIEIKKFVNIADARNTIEADGFPSFIICDNDLGPGNEKGVHFADWLLSKKYDKFVIWTSDAEIILKSSPQYDVIDKGEYVNLIDFVLKCFNT